MGGKGSGAKPKVYLPGLVSEVARLYETGLTQREVADALGTTQKVIWRLMKRHGISSRTAAKREQSGSANHMWKGAEAGYQALHLRVSAARGTPSVCGRCGSKDEPDVVYEWANLTGRYDDIYDYERMCRSCHRQYDASR